MRTAIAAAIALAGLGVWPPVLHGSRRTVAGPPVG
jgi:hypothetical protein